MFGCCTTSPAHGYMCEVSTVHAAESAIYGSYMHAVSVANVYTLLLEPRGILVDALSAAHVLLLLPLVARGIRTLTAAVDERSPWCAYRDRGDCGDSGEGRRSARDIWAEWGWLPIS